MTLQEAAAAIERHQLPEDQQKRADALDMQALLKEIRGSWWGAEMNADPVAWMEEIRCTHARIQQHADSHHAGRWKRQTNVAGQLRFPLAEKVIPGLRWAHHHAQQATPGLARATILYVGIVLVHPFNDGNGRIARVVMNQELAHNELQRAAVPYHCLMAIAEGVISLSTRGEYDAIWGAIVSDQQWTQSISWHGAERARKDMIKEEVLQEGPFGTVYNPTAAKSVSAPVHNLWIPSE